MNKKRKYDYLLVGAGLFNAIFAFEATKIGKTCLVVEKRKHIGGNLFCENIEGIQVHRYGPHIFHSKHKEIWMYINSICEFNNFIYSPLANYKGEIYNLPFNMNTFYQLWKARTPIEAQEIIIEQSQNIKDPSNLEEYALSLVGRDIYQKLIKGYTEKQWGKTASELPTSIIKRLPLRFIYDNNYFEDSYQGIPVGGYNSIFEKCFEKCRIILDTDFDENRFLREEAETVIYTGAIDRYFNYCYGALEYRSLRFETEILNINNFQGNAVVNYTDKDTQFTRIIEHKHFEKRNCQKTVITREYPLEWVIGLESFYPINTPQNEKRYQQYAELGIFEKNIHFKGRLGEYKYYNMDQIVSSALILFNNLKNNVQ